MPAMASVKQDSPSSAEPGIRAVSLDALGTLVELEPPWIHLAEALGAKADERLIGAMRAEMAYYRAHSHLGRDAGSLAELRRRCARVLSEKLGQDVDVETMMGAIRFRAYPDSAPALEAMRSLGMVLVCVSNWDCSRPGVLARCGLAGALDGIVTSAQAGARKPDPAIFAPALELAGCEPARMLHVGDTVDEDIAGARAAGLSALLLDRSGDGDIASLAEVPERLESMPGP